MNKGEIIESGHPFELLMLNESDEFITRDTPFAQLVLNTGKKNS